MNDSDNGTYQWPAYCFCRDAGVPVYLAVFEAGGRENGKMLTLFWHIMVMVKQERKAL